MAKTTKTVTTATEAPAKAAGATAIAGAAPVVAAPVIKKKDLIDQVVERSGIKKKDAKPVIEAMLAVLGEAINRGDELNLRPLGKVKVTRRKEAPNADVMVCKVRQPTGVPGGGAGPKTED
ncbi:HU family DNA-binding protein [Aliiroseovarius sp. YM-037]|uniref:HU family DNA-binding protein n=1 Tax=Aliiroseovarius sp. YM-037 TaxID=3341728 RepID=UPI003A7FDFD5